MEDLIALKTFQLTMEKAVEVEVEIIQVVMEIMRKILFLFVEMVVMIPPTMSNAMITTMPMVTDAAPTVLSSPVLMNA